MSNYPPGAKYDPNAPYNEKERGIETVKLEVSVTISKDIELEVPKDPSNFETHEILQDLVDETIQPIDWEVIEIDWKKL